MTPRSFLARELKAPDPATLAAAAALLALACFFVRGAVFAGGTLFARDIHLVWLPQVESFVRAVAAGEWPLWDPYRGFGQPLLADPSAEVAYPFAWLNLVLDPATSYTIFVLAHLLLSGLGLRALCLRQGLSRSAALLAALVWIGSGPFLSLAATWHHMAGAAWMPWVILAGESAFAEGGRRPSAAFGIALALQILAGSADMAAMTLVALAILLLARAPGSAPGRGAWARRIGALAAGFALAAALSAVLWLPALELARSSARRELPEAERTVWSLHPLALAEIALPFSWNRLPLGSVWASEVLESREPWLQSFYCGVPVLGLVAAALAGAPRRLAGPAVVLAGAVLVALGRHLPVYAILVSLLPPLRILRFPMKAMVMAALAWSLLAGHGLDMWRAAAATRRWRSGVVLPIAILTALSLAAFASVSVGASWLGPLLASEGGADWAARLRPTAWRLGWSAAASLLALGLALSARRAAATRLAMAALAVASLAATHARLIAVAPRALFAYRPEAVEIVGASRVYVYDYSVRPARAPAPARIPYQVARSPAGWELLPTLSLGVQAYLNPPAAGRWGVFGSYDFDLLGLQPRELADLSERLREAEGTPLHLRLLQLASVDYVLDLAPAARWPELQPVASLPGFFRDAIGVFRVPAPLPRSYVVAAARTVAPALAFASLSDPAFDPRREVVLSAPPAATSIPAQGALDVGSSRVVSRGAGRVVVDAELRTPGYLVLVEAWDPGWRALVDGRDAPVLRANVAFRAVALEAGAHRVEFAYRPRSFVIGATASAVGALVTALFLARGPQPAPSR